MSEKLDATVLRHGVARPRSLRQRYGPALLGAACLTWLGVSFVHQYGPRMSPSQPLQKGDGRSSSSDLCLTPACVHAASEILYNLSPDYKDLDPCEDFEELVCSGWRDHHDLRPDQGDAFTGTIMAESSQLLLRHILEGPSPETLAEENSDDRDNFEKLRAAYGSCLDEDVIKKAGLKPILDFLDEVNSEPSWTTSHDGLVGNATLLLSKYGVHPFIAADVGADDRDPDVVVASVSPPWTFGLPSKERYEDSKLLEKYRSVVLKVVGEIFPQQDKEIISKVVDLEKRLAAASPSVEEREDVTKTYNPMSVDEASGLAPQVGLKGLFEGLAPPSYDTERIIVTSPKYLHALGDILSDTSQDVLQTYISWKVVQSFAGAVKADELKPYERFRNELAGKDPDSSPERWRECVQYADQSVGWLLSRFFVEKAFSAEAKEFGDKIIKDIKTEFVTKLKATDWMDQVTTDRAVNKVHNIIQKIGYPTSSPDIANATELRDYYQDLRVNSKDFFGNVLSSRAFEVAREWSQLGKPVDRNLWGMTVPTVNAYYNPPGNEIVFPAGIMQFPVFDVNLPAYVSYGAFGSVAGHELSHAFDSTGRHYDETGNLTEWWTESTIHAFEERANCFVDQYANFTVEGPDGKPLHVNGRLTLGENVADAGGLSAAFLAWQRRSRETPNKNLPGLEHFTQEQLFFVSYSNWWCGKSRKDAAVSKIYTDPHAPKWARILGTMANSREFRESFSCKSKEPTCKLW